MWFLDMQGRRGLCCVLCRIQYVIPSHRGLEEAVREGCHRGEPGILDAVRPPMLRAAGIIAERSVECRIQRGPSQHVIAPGVPNVKR